MARRWRMLGALLGGVLLHGAIQAAPPAAPVDPSSLQHERKQVEAQRQRIAQLQRALQRQECERQQAAAALDQRDRQIQALQQRLQALKPAANAP